MAVALIDRAQKDTSGRLIISPAWLFYRHKASETEFAKLFQPKLLQLAMADISASAQGASSREGFLVRAKYSGKRVGEVKFYPFGDKDDVVKGWNFKWTHVVPPQGESGIWQARYLSRALKKDPPLLAALKRHGHKEVKFTSVSTLDLS